MAADTASWLHDSGHLKRYTHVQARVLATLAWHVDESTGWALVTVPALARTAPRVHPNTARGTLRKAVDGGLIFTDSPSLGGRGRATRYRFVRT